MDLSNALEPVINSEPQFIHCGGSVQRLNTGECQPTSRFAFNQLGMPTVLLGAGRGVLPIPTHEDRPLNSGFIHRMEHLLGRYPTLQAASTIGNHQFSPELLFSGTGKITRISNSCAGKQMCMRVYDHENAPETDSCDPG
ncbi:MAG: hypothetical protein BWY82_01776 [Verrucomicrobia bacterium ADurb.Bin474]|nr:MAG: hypothetical protein BWY82_01776 [Verrucomicrobia bacterium ADurb.Bin474]